LKEDPFPIFLQLNALVDNSEVSFLFIIAGFVFILFLMFLSALVSGSEVSFFSLDSKNLINLAQIDARKEHRIRRLLMHPNRLLATILIANNFINVAIIVFFYYFSNELMIHYGIISSPGIAFLIQVVLITFLLVLLGEITPKVYAKQNAVKFSSKTSGFIWVLQSIFHPLSSILLFATSFIDDRVKRKSSSVSMEEISQAIELTEDLEESDEDRRILKSIVEFGNIDVKEIMKPRTDVVAIEKDAPYKEVLNTVISSSFSRIPIYEKTFDSIKGVLYIKDLLPFIEDEDLDWLSLCHQPMFVPETKKINELLKEFQERKIHLAIVVDEYGGTSGIITLEDILEEIVGDIVDEFDDDGKLYSQLDRSTFVFEAKTSLNDFLKIVNGKHDYFDNLKGDTDTIAGLILESTGYLPKISDEIDFPPYKFIIESVDERKINRVKVVIS
tara:strand:+ start:708 stop:2039 length:1332 start_codon:yes stop_codon:yes gene_type:complete